MLCTENLTITLFLLLRNAPQQVIISPGIGKHRVSWVSAVDNPSGFEAPAGTRARGQRPAGDRRHCRVPAAGWPFGDGRPTGAGPRRRRAPPGRRGSPAFRGATRGGPAASEGGDPLGDGPPGSDKGPLFAGTRGRCRRERKCGGRQRPCRGGGPFSGHTRPAAEVALRGAQSAAGTVKPPTCSRWQEPGRLRRRQECSSRARYPGHVIQCRKTCTLGAIVYVAYFSLPNNNILYARAGPVFFARVARPGFFVRVARHGFFVRVARPGFFVRVARHGSQARGRVRAPSGRGLPAPAQGRGGLRVEADSGSRRTQGRRGLSTV
jgi:hypothetical protein